MEKLIVRKNTASFDIDAQKGFTPLCPDELPVDGGDRIAGALNDQAGHARLRIGSKDAHCRQAIYNASPEHPQFSTLKAENADLYWNTHCVPGTEGFELIPGLPRPIEYDFFVWKGIEPDLHPYGACFHDLAERKSTGVIEYLKLHHIATVICGGLATDYCVKNTALQLTRAGFRVIVNLLACRGVDEKTSAQAVKRMRDAGVLVVDSLAGFERC
jgi:nicotinamidase/pyrazinamidase